MDATDLTPPEPVGYMCTMDPETGRPMLRRPCAMCEAGEGVVFQHLARSGALRNCWAASERCHSCETKSMPLVACHGVRARGHLDYPRFQVCGKARVMTKSCIEADCDTCSDRHHRCACACHIAPGLRDLLALGAEL